MSLPKHVLVFFLFERRRESAIVATTTFWKSGPDSESFEWRVPASYGGEQFNQLMMDGEGDMRVRQLTNDQQFRAWLQSESGWAAIDMDLANDIMPKWLAARECRTVPVETTPVFFDRALLSEIESLVPKLKSLFGPEAPEGLRTSVPFWDNVMIASLPL